MKNICCKNCRTQLAVRVRFLLGHHVLVYGLRTPTELLVRCLHPLAVRS